MAEMALPLLIGSTAISAIGSIQQGNAAMSAAERESAGLRANAEIAQKNSIARDDQTRRQQRMQVGTMLAAGAESGAGISADALRGSLYDMEMDSSTIRYEGNLKAAGLNDQAGATLEDGKQKRTAGYLNAFGSLMSGASSYATGAKKGVY